MPSASETAPAALPAAVVQASSCHTDNCTGSCTGDCAALRQLMGWLGAAVGRLVFGCGAGRIEHHAALAAALPGDQ